MIWLAASMRGQRIPARRTPFGGRPEKGAHTGAVASPQEFPCRNRITLTRSASVSWKRSARRKTRPPRRRQRSRVHRPRRSPRSPDLRQALATPAAKPAARALTEPLLLSTARISTFLGTGVLTAATGFFFERDSRLFLVTSRHVLYDPVANHLPDRIELTVHADASDLTRTIVLSILLYRNGKADWHQGEDIGGEIDVAVLEIDRKVLPPNAVFSCFGPANLQPELAAIAVGETVLLPGFPLGFYDTVHHLPVVRHAIIASSFGVRFQGQGFFLTDARMH